MNCQYRILLESNTNSNRYDSLYEAGYTVTDTDEYLPCSQAADTFPITPENRQTNITGLKSDRSMVAH